MRSPRREGQVQLRRLPALAGDDLAALRAHVEQTIARSKKLREMAARTGYTPEDVASEALARYLGVSDKEIENPAAWMVTAGRNFVYDLHKKGVQREMASEPGSRTLDQPRPGEQLPVDESLDRRFESRLYDAAIRRLDERDRHAVAAFEEEGSMRAVEKRYGIPKSNVQRAFKRLQEEIAGESGSRAPGRARSRALAYHLGFLSPSQVEELQSRLSWDTGLLMELRALQLGAKRTAALFPVPVAAETANTTSSLGDRLAVLGDRAREGLHGVLARSGGHEAEAAGAGITGGGFATKAIVAACIGGSAAAGVCVEQDVVRLPGADPSEAPAQDRPAQDSEAASTQTTSVEPAPIAETQDDIVSATEEKPVEQINKELGLGDDSGGTTSSGSRDFAAPSSTSTSSGASGGGGSSGASRESFGP